MERPKCLILDMVYEDYYTVWEILSHIRDKLEISQDQAIEIVNQILKQLAADQLIEFYQGTSFTGEELMLANFEPPVGFVKDHADDWKVKSFGDTDIRIYISDMGRDQYLNHCKDIIF